MKMNKKIVISGAYHSKFGRLEDDSLYSLYENALKGALSDAQLSAQDIDGVFVGNFSGGGFNKQENIASYAINILPELRHKPVFRVETACASGSSAIHLAIMSILSGMMKRVVVVGLEKMTSVSTPRVSEVLSYATFWEEEGAKGVNAPCMFAELAKGYIAKYQIGEDQLRPVLAEIASKAYTNAAANPLAQLQKPRSADEILNLSDEKNPIIYAPLRLHDCSLISDGSAAIVLELDEVSDSDNKVTIAGFYNAGDYLDLFGKNKSSSFLDGAAYAVKKALDMAEISIDDIGAAEVHDCFTITELLMYSALGIVPPGEEARAIREGWVLPEGRIPINLSGGLKAKGHPIGATGVSMHAYLYMQLLDKSYGVTKNGIENALIANIGGSGTSNAVTVLSRR